MSNEQALEVRSIGDVVKQINEIQIIMKKVMKKDIHYGVIPGCKKPSLWKPGAELLLATFRIAVFTTIEDLSTTEEARYRVKAVGKNMLSGTELGCTSGEASSFESKYKWRAAICDAEFENSHESRRRLMYKKVWRNKSYEIETVNQVMTEKADQANTVLKMAEKRSLVGFCLRVLAASDIFDQSEYEDMSDAIDVIATDGGTEGGTDHPKDVMQPKEKATTSASNTEPTYLDVAKDGFFIWTGPKETKDIPKSAGLKWNAEKFRWETDRIEIAATLGSYATDSALMMLSGNINA